MYNAQFTGDIYKANISQKANGIWLDACSTQYIVDIYTHKVNISPKEQSRRLGVNFYCAMQTYTQM